MIKLIEDFFTYLLVSGNVVLFIILPFIFLTLFFVILYLFRK